MIKGLRVKSFRSFIDSGPIELRPLTIFVGRNSSGKSSILRLLPLLKQSVSEETKEPVLWFGGVDFGSLGQVQSRFSPGQPVTFEIAFDSLAQAGEQLLISEFGEKIYLRMPEGQSIFLNESLEVSLSQELQLSKSGVGVRIASLVCNIGTDSLSLTVGERGEIVQITFNEVLLEEIGSVSVAVTKKGFFPRFVDNSRTTSAAQAFRSGREGPFFAALHRALSGVFHHRAQEEGRRSLTSSLKFGSRSDFSGHMEAVFSSTASRIAGLESTNGLERIRGLVLLRLLPEIVRRASHQLDKFCTGVRYIEPVRARALRYYRYQELAVDEIASDGANVPVFLHALNSSERRDLEDWLSASLGFTVRAERSGDGHIQLLVQEKDTGSLVNLADTGFGYSQILPIALQLWKVNRTGGATPRGATGVPSVIAIEQPELHLHPQMQAMLGDVFALSLTAARDARKSLRLVLETHSEHLINRVGELIGSGHLASDDVAVYVFERENMGAPTEVKRAAFDNGGYLLDPWPLGFFLPSVKMEDILAEKDAVEARRANAD